MPSRTPATPPPQLVYVVDDDPDVLEAIGDLLASIGRRATLFPSVDAFLAAMPPDPCGCLVLDVRLPGRSGLDFHQDLVKAGITLPVIFLSGHADVPMSVRAMKGGAFEFFTKPVRNQDLLDAIQAALARDKQRRVESEAHSTLRSAHARLTPREREVMGLVAAGLLNKQIAAELGVAEATIKLHRGQVMRKMGVRSLADLVRAADQLKAAGLA